MAEIKVVSAYPLAWPQGWKRYDPNNRAFGKFSKKETKYWPSGGSYQQTTGLSVGDSVGRIVEQLGMMGVERKDLIISTNVEVRVDGLPRSGQKKPNDPGAAVYWTDRPNQPMRCMAIDRYTKVQDNLAAIGATLEAMRAIERHGGAEILDRAFTGFSALPAKASSAWREIIDVPAQATMADVLDRFRVLMKRWHPDSGEEPNEEKTRELIQAREDARKEFGAAL